MSDNENLKIDSFRVLEVKMRFYKNSDLYTMSIIIDKKEYEVSFLVDNYESFYYPELRADENSIGNLVNVIYNKLNIKYQMILDSKNSESNSDIDYYEDDIEWWRPNVRSVIDIEINSWIKENEDYISDLGPIDFMSTKDFDSLKKYLEKRSEFVKPRFLVDSLDEDNDLYSLKERLKKAELTEDYIEAAKIMDKIKKKKCI